MTLDDPKDADGPWKWAQMDYTFTQFSFTIFPSFDKLGWSQRKNGFWDYENPFRIQSV